MDLGDLSTFQPEILLDIGSGQEKDRRRTDAQPVVERFTGLRFVAPSQ